MKKLILFAAVFYAALSASWADETVTLSLINTAKNASPPAVVAQTNIAPVAVSVAPPQTNGSNVVTGSGGAVASKPDSDRTIRFQFDGIPYMDAIERFAQMVNKPLLSDAKVDGNMTFSDPLPYNYAEALDALNLILSMKDVMLIESDRYLRLVPLKKLAQMPVRLFARLGPNRRCSSRGNCHGGVEIAECGSGGNIPIHHPNVVERRLCGASLERARAHRHGPPGKHQTHQQPAGQCGYRGAG